LLNLADGREGPEDAGHATQLVIARALISIAESLEKLVEAKEIEAERQELQQMVNLYKID
jgi:hypothetical protein